MTPPPASPVRVDRLLLTAGHVLILTAPSLGLEPQVWTLVAYRSSDANAFDLDPPLPGSQFAPASLPFQYTVRELVPSTFTALAFRDLDDILYVTAPFELHTPDAQLSIESTITLANVVDPTHTYHPGEPIHYQLVELKQLMATHIRNQDRLANVTAPGSLANLDSSPVILRAHQAVDDSYAALRALGLSSNKVELAVEFTLRHGIEHPRDLLTAINAVDDLV